MPAGPVARTILLKGSGVFKEAVAGGAVTPGHLVQYNASKQLVVHNAAESDAFPMFALEQDFVGKEITTAYALNDQMLAIVPQNGAEIYALLPANAAAVVIGDELVSNGDGTLKKVTAAVVAVGNLRRVVARALEAIDNSAVGTPARIRVEVV